MQLPRISIAKPRWSLRYLLTTSRHFSSISKSKSKYLDLKDYLFSRVRSLFASKSIQTGDCILRVPYSAQIASDNLLPELSDLLGDEVGSVAKLAIVLLVDQKVGQESKWAPYISRLPQLGEMHSTIFWSKSELDMIFQSSVYKETIKQKAQIEKDFLTIKPVLEHFPQISRSITFQDFMHAYALVKSRAWGSTKGVSLIPFADFLNHDGFSEAVVLNDEDKQVSEVAADRNYAPHEEVLIRYGKFSNATLLLDFGFSLPYNIHEQVEIQINIPDHDTLREMKFEILRLHHIPATKDDNGFNSSWDSFLIKEVRSAGGKGKGLPQSLRAFARVLCCTSHQDLNDLVLEAAQTDGRLARRALENSSREIQAHEILLSRINQVIEEYSASIKLLESSTSLSICKRFALRRQMALDLLTGELRVLKSASAWLKNYCTSLLQQTPQTTISSANSDHVSVQE
ncbi:Ribulose-1,5 bisphosphate carboxylase/oxygenase large subunit N-methyltransferase, chloroplast precursor, putative [Ricinus communis]|uniref:Ribulose-1,5 bisphosphate carboxylase/oxygenase large subunit N-methyltransferase, chloroplast, putative n=1 Tax=Ricinus communis TaxID=3988 RepID=B9SGF2_RICCO|nr:Ribulose-1,5 bisphosphate carboxylase/oxygenase large subunit N-methyltransferase, chloroplast precursor, putative [Ricinus communis]